METAYGLLTGTEEERQRALKEAARILRAGGLVAFPTETVFYDPLSYSVSCHTGPNAFGMGVSVRWEPGMRN